MNENKNLVVALILMLGVWFGYNALYPPVKPTVEAPTAAVQAQSEAVATSPATLASVTPPAAATAPQPSVTLAPAREVVIDTQRYRAVFTSSGARLVSFELKDYHTTADPQSAPVQMLQPGPLRFASLRTRATEGLALSADDSYEVSTSAAEVAVAAGESYRLTFTRTTATGVEVVKTFTFAGDLYTIDCNLALRNAGSVPLRGTLDFALVQQWDDELNKDSYSFTGPASLVEGKVDEVKAKDLLEEPVAYAKDLAWTSFQSKYFLTAIVPQGQAASKVRIIRDNNAIENILETDYLELAPGQQRQIDYFLYVGPKDFDLLKAANHQLDKAIHFGFFDLLAKPLYFVLTFFYGFLQNYGLSIILLTVIIKLIFWPLTHKSYSSMKAMQKLQPEMQKVRERFKNDKERLNRELMELYKTHRVNPLGGCLPMLVQIPVFFALYKVLLDSITLRHAPFAFWLTDLSAKDPYYITPVLMGISMFVQQKMTPSSPDPTQAKVMMFLPIIFTFMFLNFPSGLVIYWLVNNLLTIVQQYYIHRKST